MLPFGTQYPLVQWKGNTVNNKAHAVQSILAVTENWANACKTPVHFLSAFGAESAKPSPFAAAMCANHSRP